MSARWGIAGAGGVALLVLLRTAAYYQRTDTLALGLVLLMTIALVAALAELLARVGRAELLGTQLAALPRPATDASLEAAPAALRALLRARAANISTPATAAPMATYVVGLLVMLGLLGTFLGLFETLRGAREALTASGDVESLRASLSQPMQGLTRSFGTSAAGVSASAMLGLAAAIARRAEGRFTQALAAYATSALAPLMPESRQLAALERLVQQGEALPAIVSTLRETSARLTSLEASWGEAHATAAAGARKALEDATTGVRNDLDRAIERAGGATEKALSPLVVRAVEGAVAAGASHLLELHRTVEAERATRAEMDLAQARRWKEHADQVAKGESARLEAFTKALTGATSGFAAAVERLERAGKEREASLVKAGEELIATARRQLDEAAKRVDRSAERAEVAVDARDVAFAEATDRALTSAGALFEKTAARFDAMADRTEVAAQARNLALSKTTEEILAAASTLFETSSARIDALAERAEAGAKARDEALAKATGDVLTTAGSLFQDSSARFDAMVGRSEAAAQARDASFARATEQVIASATALFEGSAARFEAMADRTETAARERSTALTNASEQMFSSAGKLLDAAAARFEATGTRDEARVAQLEALVERLDARDDAQTSSLMQIRKDVEALLASSDARVRALDEDMRGRHEALASLVADSAEAHAERTATLERELGEALARHAEQLVATLTAHAEGLRAQADAGAGALQGAAASLEAGSAELAGVAEMFAGTVDLHRKAAAEWLEGLGSVEAAVERAGESVAARALGEELDRARELFDAQLQFHRELLVQLRNPRTIAPPAMVDEPLEDHAVAAR